MSFLPAASPLPRGRPENRATHKRPNQFFRAGIAKEVIDAYAIAQPTNPILYMGVWQESHATPAAPDAAEDERTHFHICLKATRCHRFKAVVEELKRRGIYVRAVSSHQSYWSMARYVCVPSARKPRNELDATPWLSDPNEEPLGTVTKHPTIANACKIPRTAVPSAAKQHAAALEEGKVKPQRLTKHVQAHNAVTLLGCRTVKKLQRFAAREADAGRPALLDFVLGQKDLRAFILQCLSIQAAANMDSEDEDLLPWDRVVAFAKRPCVCNGTYIPSACAVLTHNGHDPEVYTTAVAKSLQHGPCKRGNVALVGASDAGKSWLVNPLNEIFTTLAKPAENSTYPLADIMDYDCVLWSEFNWAKFQKTIGLDDMILWWGGETHRVGVSKSVSPKDLERDPAHVPVFLTMGEPIHAPTQRLQKMVNNRINYFYFPKSLDKVDDTLQSCAPCWARWVTVVGRVSKQVMCRGNVVE